MTDFLTPSNVTFIIGLLGIMFGVYNYFRNPQIKSEKTDALMEQRVSWMVDISDRRFKDMQDNFKELLLQSNNHIHTVDTKVDALQGIIIGMGQEIIKLGTIIEERIPKKHG